MDIAFWFVLSAQVGVGEVSSSSPSSPNFKNARFLKEQLEHLGLIQPQKSAVLPRYSVSNPKRVLFCPETQFPTPKGFFSTQKLSFQPQKHSVLPRNSVSSSKRVLFCPEAVLPVPKGCCSAQKQRFQPREIWKLLWKSCPITTLLGELITLQTTGFSY